MHAHVSLEGPGSSLGLIKGLASKDSRSMATFGTAWLYDMAGGGRSIHASSPGFAPAEPPRTPVSSRSPEPVSAEVLTVSALLIISVRCLRRDSGNIRTDRPCDIRGGHSSPDVATILTSGGTVAVFMVSVRACRRAAFAHNASRGLSADVRRGTHGGGVRDHYGTRRPPPNATLGIPSGSARQ